MNNVLLYNIKQIGMCTREMGFMVMESLKLCLMIEGGVKLQEVDEILVELGFDRRFNDLAWYRWSSKYESTLGCEFSIESGESIEINGNNISKSLLTAVTYRGRSHADLEMQNKVISKLQQKFGGVLCDERGLPTDFIENTLPQLTSTEIACDLEYARFLSNLTRFRRLIEEVDDKLVEQYQLVEESAVKEILSTSLSHDVPLLRNNTLIPFAVASLEDFFKNFLVKNLETNEKARDVIFQNDRKIKYSEIKEILSGEKSLIDMEMDFYNFQNLESVNNVYKKFLKFDIFKEVLQKEMLIEKEKVTVLSVLSELITIRHKVIHEASLDYTLGKKKMNQYASFLSLFGEEFMNKFRDKMGLRNAFIELDIEVIKE